MHLSFSNWQSISLCNQQDYHNLSFAISRSHSHKNEHADHTIITVLLEFREAISLQTMVLSKWPFWRWGVKYYGYCCRRHLYKCSMHANYSYTPTSTPTTCRLAFCKITSLTSCMSVILKLSMTVIVLFMHEDCYVNWLIVDNLWMQ